MAEMRALLQSVRAVAFGWHGVLFDRGRVAVHAATRQTLARWGVEVGDAPLVESRGPVGRPQLRRLFAIPQVAQQFRDRQNRWLTEEALDVMTRDLEERLVEAARSASEPNADACAALRRLREMGLGSAAICCSPRRLLAAQLESLERARLPLDCVVTADESCEPVPAPWAIFEVLRRLGISDPSLLVLVDDNPHGATAARKAGASSIALATPGAVASADAKLVLQSLDDLAR